MIRGASVIYASNGTRLAISAAGALHGHCALLRGRAVIATDAGLVMLKNDSGVLLEAFCYSDTQPFVSAGDELLPHPGGSVFRRRAPRHHAAHTSVEGSIAMPLPLPHFYDPKQVPSLYLERAGLVAAAGEEYAAQHKIKPAGSDAFKIAAFGIDVQAGLCRPCRSDATASGMRKAFQMVSRSAIRASQRKVAPGAIAGFFAP